MPGNTFNPNDPFVSASRKLRKTKKRKGRPKAKPKPKNTGNRKTRAHKANKSADRVQRAKKR